MQLTHEQLDKMIPLATDADLLKYLAPINETLAYFHIQTPLQVAAFIAQITHESCSFRYTSEIASGKAYDKRADLGNLDAEAKAICASYGKGLTIGAFYKGHGLCQITGYFNHKKVSEALGIDCVKFPLMLCEPRYAALSAGWFWNSKNLNELADHSQFTAITKKINGGVNGLEDRVANYKRCLTVLGLPIVCL